MTTDKVRLVPVDSDQHVCMLRKYRAMLQRALGPNGSSTAVVTGGGYLQVTSISAILMDRLEIESPLCRFINNMAAKLPNHGFYSAIILSHLLEQQGQKNLLSIQTRLKVVHEFINEIRTLLLSENVCIKVDFNSLNSFLPLVQTVISSKCPTLLSGINLSKFCIEIIKVFISCIDDQKNVIGRVYIKVESGSNMFTSFKGLLYNLTDSKCLDFIKQITGDINVLVFTLALEENCVKGYSVVDKVLQILEKAVEYNVNLVACQKTVAAEVKLFLMRRKIILLERMGSDFTAMLINTSQAFPVSELSIDTTEIVNLTGRLSLVQHVQFGESDYILLHSESVPVGTLLIQSCSLAGVDHVKVLVEQSVSSMRSVAANPALIIGGGCLETWLIAQIRLLKNSSKEKESQVISQMLQYAFLSTCSSTMVDSVYNHGWKEERETCECRMVIREDVEQASGSWVPIRDVITHHVTLRPPKQPNLLLRSDVLVEPHHQKVNVIISVLEAFTNLSNIGLVMYKD